MGRTSNEAKDRYNRKAYKQFILRLRYDTDHDVIGYLQEQKSANATIKEAIREKMQKSGSS